MLEFKVYRYYNLLKANLLNRFLIFPNSNQELVTTKLSVSNVSDELFLVYWQIKIAQLQ